MKESYYFQHDCNARNDHKLQRLMMKYGVAGIGTYWCIVEMLYEQGGRIGLDYLETIAFSLHVETEMLHSVIFEMGLFVSDEEVFWSESVLNRLEERATRYTSSEAKRRGGQTGNNNARKNESKTNKNESETNTDESKTNKNESETNTKTNKNESPENENHIKERKEEKRKEEYLGEKEKKRGEQDFCPPSLSEVRAYAQQEGFSDEVAINFFHHYQAKGWLFGKSPMRSWEAGLISYIRDPLSVRGSRAGGAGGSPKACSASVAKSGKGESVNDVWENIKLPWEKN